MGRYIIFGGGGGIGSATAARLAEEGHTLVLAGRNEATLRQAADGMGAEIVVCDILDDAAIAAAAETVEGPLDGLAYAVGTINLKPFAKLTEADFLNDFRVNALGAAKVVQAFLPHLTAAREGASVLLFSTVAVEQGFAAHASIAMAKGAVVGLMRSLAAELAPQVRVNAIAPSLVATPLGRTVAGNERMEEAIGKMHPLPRIGQPEDVAALASLLLTPASSWITGQVFGVDGGRSTLRTPKS
ncbi:SDR family oxidoreductase [Aurantimonas sp. Leaf443]|uniref:SDR family NAD(P)-dependent oxidoreductase n=1 Tax=Aurantimonas sp. Leaf443 TaxID=1736378 RepID=UPI0006FC307F|nr:SDR family oxidoreductase [Aurantimonas sp. Leaf443]KQT86274.1 short-chain dehydrogenase [Aurantimonas sp. Leaf443]